MGQCTICGKEIEDGKDICDSCQQDLEKVDVDLEGLDDLDFDLKDFELSELSGDVMETDLEFELDDPNNNLENPDIFVHDMEETSNMEEISVDEMSSEEEATNEPLESEKKEEEPVTFLESEASDSQEEMDLPDLGALLSGVEESASEEGMDLSALLPDDDMSDLGLDTLDLNGDEASPSEEDKGFVDDILGSIDTADATKEADTAVADVLEEDPLGGMSDDILNLFPNDSMDGIADVGGAVPDTEAEPNLDILGAVPDAEEMAELAKPKQKISIWKRLFGNVKDEKWEKQKAKEEEKEAQRLAKEEAKKAKEAEAASEGAEGSEGEKIDPKEAKKAEKLAKKEEKARLKAEKKAEKQRLKELAELEDPDEGRINRLGAAIVFVFFGIVAAFIIIGTNMFAYNSSINRASVYFEEDEYSAAYNAINGLDIKEKDQELYDQIKTVMYVDKELNSYRNYNGIRMYPEALDSLIKGLEKYDQHIEDAKEMDVTEDLDKVRGSIISELKKEYGLTEKEAYKLSAMEDQKAYSKKVIEIANK